MAGSTHPRIALIDDDSSVRESLPVLLMRSGFEVATFSSAREFVASGDIARTECLLLDFAMPGMSGRELMHHMIAAGHHVPTIFITAQGDEAMRQRLLEEGATECLFKPFSPDALLLALRRVFPGR